MSAIKEVKGYMSFWGWTNQGGPGAMKFDADNKIIAHHGDAMWVADVEKASATIARIADRVTSHHGSGHGGGGRRGE